jgi:hypothetical protein
MRTPALRILGVLLISSFVLAEPHLHVEHRTLSVSDGHWSLTLVAFLFIGSGLLLSLYGRYLVKITVILAGAILGWLVFQQLAYQLAINSGNDEEAANNIAMIAGLVGSILLAMAAWKIFKFGFFVFGALFGILLASTLNTAFLHEAVASISGQNNVGYAIMAIFAIVFGCLFYCFEDVVVVAASAFVGAYLLVSVVLLLITFTVLRFPRVHQFYGIGYFAGDFPDTFNIGQNSSHQQLDKVPTIWYLYFAAIIGWTILGIHVQYRHTAGMGKKKNEHQRAQPRQGNGYAQMA